MALGTNRTRNWGKDAQRSALACVLLQRKVAFKVLTEGPRKTQYLYLAPSSNGVTLGYESVARLENVRRGDWKAYSVFDDSLLGSGHSQRDVVRSTIQKVWN